MTIDRANDAELRPVTAAPRTPWRHQPAADDRRRRLRRHGGRAWMWRRLGRGPAGPTAGRVFHRMRLRAQEETTAQIAGTYPFVAERGFSADGAYIGRDRFTRGAFRFDPFELYRAGLLPNPNVGIFGTIGSGKSSLIKTMALRLLAFGVRFIVPADTKGEMVGPGPGGRRHPRRSSAPAWATPSTPCTRRRSRPGCPNAPTSS